MWQRFTERARRVILLAQEEAGKMNSGHVGTEHLLLGLARLNEGSGLAVLQRMGLGRDEVRAATLAAMSAPDERISGEPKLTGMAKRALELGADEARRLGHNYIGTEHLLLALLRVKDEIPGRVLRGLGLNLDDTRKHVVAYLDKAPAPIMAAEQSPTEAVARFHVAPAVRQSLDFAAQESREVGASQVEIVHLLRALCRPDSESAQILTEAGVDVEALCARLGE